MKKIKLGGLGGHAFVDDDDYAYLSQWKWYRIEIGYAVTYTNIMNTNNKFPMTFLHRLILKAPKNKQVDHINMNKLDNRKNSLRLADKSKNMCNRGLQKNNTSGYKGVTRRKQNVLRIWTTRVKKDGIQHVFGSYRTKEEAAYVYDQVVMQLHGEFARFNIL